MVIVKPMTTSELPKLVGEIMLDVFTHKSIKVPTSSVSEHDNERLAVLGKSALEMATTFVLFRQRPVQTAEEIAVRIVYCPTVPLSHSSLKSQKAREAILSDRNFEQWVTANGLLEKLRSAPGGSINDDPEVSRVFYRRC